MKLEDVEFSESMYVPGDFGGENFRHFVSGKHVDWIELTDSCVIMAKGKKLREYSLGFVKSWKRAVVEKLETRPRRKVRSG